MGVSNYPASLDNFATTSPPNLGDNDSTSRKHAARHDDLEAAMEAVQGELGTNPSGTAATVAARLGTVDTTLSGKANTVHTHAQADVTGLPAVVTEVNVLSVDVATLQGDVAYRIKGYTSSNQPASPAVGDLWVDPDDSSVKIWNGSAFVNPSNAGGGGGPTWATVTGGTTSTPPANGDGTQDEVHTFTANGTLTVTVAGWARVFAAAGGAYGAASGGSNIGGGGPVREGIYWLPAGPLAVTIGAGGTAGSVHGLVSSLGSVVVTGRSYSAFWPHTAAPPSAGATNADMTAEYSTDISGAATGYGKSSQASPRANRGDGATNGAGTAGVVIVRTRKP